MTVFQDPEFNKRWAEICEAESRQPNGRRMFVTLYCHPVIGHLRIAKWLPKRNVSSADSDFLTMLADDLRYAKDLFVVENGPFEGHYQKVTDIESLTGETTKISIQAGNDSGFCPNCSANSNATDSKNETDPDFIEVPDSFSESDTEYEIIQNKARSQPQTSSRAENQKPKPKLDISSISNDANETLERRKC